MIRSKDEAMAAIQRYLDERGEEADFDLIGEPRMQPAEIGGVKRYYRNSYYEIGVTCRWIEELEKKLGPGTCIMPTVLALCVRVSDGVVMTDHDVAYDESLLRNEADALERLKRYLVEEQGIARWRVVGSLSMEDRPSGVFYLAQVLHGAPGDEGEPSADAEPIPYYIRVEWSDVFTLSQVEYEDEVELEEPDDVTDENETL